MYTLLVMASLNGTPALPAFGGSGCLGAPACDTCATGWSPLGFRLRYPFGGFFSNMLAKCRAKHAVWHASDCGCSAPVSHGCVGCFGCGGCGGLIVDPGMGCVGCFGCAGHMVTASPLPHGAMPPPMDAHHSAIPGLPPGAVITPMPHSGPMPSMPAAPVPTPNATPMAPGAVPNAIPPVSYYRPIPVPPPAPAPTTLTRAVAVGTTDGEPLSARLTFEVPAGATLFVDGVAIPGSGSTRKFHTPPLPRGKTFYYEFRAEVRNGDKIEKQEKVIPICAGDLVSEKLMTAAQ